jgi:UDP-glucose 4-epimerase
MKKQKILITGAAGYIGSVVSNYLSNYYHVFGLDNLSVGKKYLLNKKISFIKSDFANVKFLNNFFKKNKIISVIHLAACTSVTESITNPDKYYHNNFLKTKILIDIIKKYNVKKFIFSSTCAVYGEPRHLPINENEKKDPENPYGKSKLMSEWFIEDYLSGSNTNYLILRFFNVLGAQSDLRAGHIDKNSQQLLKKIFDSIVSKKYSIDIYGRNCKSIDGTCVRDYIDVRDLAIIIKKGIFFLNKQKSEIINCGYGKGFTVLQIINEVEKLINKKFYKNFKKKRAGDPEILFSDNIKISKLLKWRPKYNNLKDMIKISYTWFKKSYYENM